MEFNPASLPPGTHVGPWRLGPLLGRGTFGTVYFAEGMEPEARGPAALKLAHAPHDERFAREVALLSRLHHPCIPRLLGHGQWQSPSGLLHPYLAMELVEGRPLYDWAQATHPTSRQVLRLLAGLARALEAVHSVGGVHRDVKGGNVLVRRSDGRGFLVDFGSCHHQGASPLTWQPYPPGTIAYRTPEAFAYAHQRLASRGTLPPYAPKPADDVFALGITAWRLVAGDYPPSAMAEQAEAGARAEAGPQPVHELNPRCSPALSRLTSRMLSVRPEARGSAGELAEALEQAARDAGPQAEVPLFLSKAPLPQGKVEQPSAPRPMSASPEREKARLFERPAEPATAEASPGPLHRRALHGSWQLWLSAGLVGAVVLGTVWRLRRVDWEVSERRHLAHHEEGRDAGSVGLGDSVLTAPVAPEPAPPGWSTIGLDLPSKPLRGQVRPDASGRCPSKNHVAINGGCWRDTKDSADNCDEYAYRYKGACYVPVTHPPLPPTSSPTDAPDGGAR